MSKDTTELRATVDTDLYERWQGTLSKNDRIPEQIERLMQEDIDG